MKKTWVLSILFVFTVSFFYRDFFYFFDSAPDESFGSSEAKKVAVRLAGFDGGRADKLRVKFIYATTSRLCEKVVNWPIVVTSPRFFDIEKDISPKVDGGFLFEFPSGYVGQGVCGWRLYRIDYEVYFHRSLACSGTMAGLHGYNSYDIGRERFIFNGTTEACRSLGMPGLYSGVVIIFGQEVRE